MLRPRRKTDRCIYCSTNKKHPRPPAGKDGDFEKLHPWFINSEAHDYCFWVYVYERSALNGDMEDCSMNEIARFLDCSITTVHLILEKAINKLKKSGNLERLLYYMEQKRKGSDLEDEFNRMIDRLGD